MVCIEVGLDGKLFRATGVKDASLLTPAISAFVGDDEPARLTLSGMCERPGERAAHVYWGDDEMLLSNGTVVTLRFTSSELASDPDQVVATDSPKYVEEQREFEELKKNVVPDTTPAPRRFPDLAFHCRINQKPAAIATLKSGEEHILCSVLWNKWHPERFRVSVRSFGNDPNSQTEWLRNDLALGDELEIRVAA
jgi:hypothetical protein